jgi:hypothetical protein
VFQNGRLAVCVATLVVATVMALAFPAAAVASDCSYNGVSATDLEVWSVNEPPYDWRVRGWGYVSDPNSKAGCTLRVCEAEELGSGNWQSFWCIYWVLPFQGQHRFHSDAPYVDCQNYGGTGWFRSSVSFDGSGITLLGPPRQVCGGGGCGLDCMRPDESRSPSVSSVRSSRRA